MKKSTIAGVLAFLVVLSSFTACSDTDTSSNSSTAEESVQTTVTEDCCEGKLESESTAEERDRATEEEIASSEAEESTAEGELEKTDFNLGYLNSTAHLLAFVAKEEGYFEEEGLRTCSHRILHLSFRQILPIAALKKRTIRQYAFAFSPCPRQNCARKSMHKSYENKC